MSLERLASDEDSNFGYSQQVCPGPSAVGRVEQHVCMRESSWRVGGSSSEPHSVDGIGERRRRGVVVQVKLDLRVRGVGHHPHPAGVAADAEEGDHAADELDGNDVVGRTDAP